MRACTLIAPAKINLYLEITGERPDGYHEVVMVLQSIALADHLSLEVTPHGIQLSQTGLDVPTGPENLAYRAAALLQKETGHNEGVAIALTKKIPIGAGLGGGSTDAAAVLVGLNQLWQLGLTHGDLESLAAQLGSDVPFCVQGGTVLALGRGEKLSPLPDLPPTPLLLAKPKDLSVSTAWAYGHYRATKPTLPGSISPMLAAIAQQNPRAVGAALTNHFEPVVFPSHPLLPALRQALAGPDTLGTIMTGSGATVFALMASQAAAASHRDRLQAQYPEIDFWLTETTPAGISLQPEAH